MRWFIGGRMTAGNISKIMPDWLIAGQYADHSVPGVDRLSSTSPLAQRADQADNGTLCAGLEPLLRCRMKGEAKGSHRRFKGSG